MKADSLAGKGARAKAGAGAGSLVGKGKNKASLAHQGARAGADSLAGEGTASSSAGRWVCPTDEDLMDITFKQRPKRSGEMSHLK